MHRWKDHVSRSLLTQMSVLHDIYRTATVVERRQQQRARATGSGHKQVGSVSMTIMGQVFRYACSTAGQSRNKRPQKKMKRDTEIMDNRDDVVSSEVSGDNSGESSGNGSSSSGGGLMPWMTRLVASEMGIRKIPVGLRGVVLFDDSLVSRHDDLFTLEDGRIESWDSFRRYWVHRWAADRLWQQLGINVCKTLLDSFDDAVDRSSKDELEMSDNELKVSHRELRRLIATDVFLAGHPIRELMLLSTMPESQQQQQQAEIDGRCCCCFQAHRYVEVDIPFEQIQLIAAKVAKKKLYKEPFDGESQKLLH